jgi:hypothetical protein
MTAHARKHHKTVQSQAISFPWAPVLLIVSGIVMFVLS